MTETKTMNLSNINRDNPPRFGDLLVPKPRKRDDLDPLIVIGLTPAERVAYVKDQSLVERDPKWTEGNKVLSCHPDTGTLRKTFRELGRDYQVDLDRRAENKAAMIERLRAKGWNTRWLEGDE